MQKKETISFKYQIIQFLHWENIEGKAGNLLFQYGKQNVSMNGTINIYMIKIQFIGDLIQYYEYIRHQKYYFITFKTFTTRA